MDRRLFLRSLTASGIALATPIAFAPRASAQLAVFDAANYANLIKQLSQTGILTASNAAIAANALNLYNEYVRQGKLNITQIWGVIAPYLTKLNQAATGAVQMPSSAQIATYKFNAAFGDYQPDQDYGDQWEFARVKAESAIQSSLQLAQTLSPQLSKQAMDIKTLTSQPATSQQDMLGVQANLAGQIAQQMIQQRQELSNQALNQAQFCEALLNQQEATRRNPGIQKLTTTLRDVGSVLITPSKAL